MPLIDILESQELDKEKKTKSQAIDKTHHQHKSSTTADSINEIQTNSFVDQMIMPQLKGLELLQDGTYTIDLEKTISDMLVVIKNMEAQLERVLEVNAQYEKEIDFSKKLIARLKSEKSKLTEKIDTMEQQIPTKRELQIEIEHIVDEKNHAHNKIQTVMETNESLIKEIQRLKDHVQTFEEERMDARMEIGYLDVQIKALQAKNRKYAHDINILKGERISFLEKIKSLHNELQLSYAAQFKTALDHSENMPQEETIEKPPLEEKIEKPPEDQQELSLRKSFSPKAANINP